MTSTDPKTWSISTIIPTLNEGPRLGDLLAALIAVGLDDLLVVDGGSHDDSVAVARSAGVRVLASPPGRGVQLHRGACETTGSILFFLHADTLPPPNCGDIIRRILALPHTAAGAFRLGLDGYGAGLRLLELGANLRSRVCQLPYGDQGLFVTREVYEAAGGFPPWPLLEDVELVRRLRHRGRVRLTDEAVCSSARRWQRRGLVRVTLMHQLLLLGYFFRVDPARLARLRRRFG
ncbi:MAG: hypothetical protein BWK76_06360 [Desulfobulbaceae bacterium A2]|nr:MAG: hypothetical protein BWK76_06360 [Desulfobulbaceae bacterium A2]